MTVPLLSRARLNTSPAEMAVTFLSLPTASGVLLHDAPLKQVSGPLTPPHSMTVPSLSRARLCSLLAEIAVTPFKPLTATGTSLPSVLPSPSCPYLLKPQAITVRLLSKAKSWSRPVEIAVTPLSPLTATGVLLQGPVPQVSGPPSMPSPSCPNASHPQDMTVLSFIKARLFSLPSETAATSVSPVTTTGTLLAVVVPLPSGPS